jgi:hypothetical protein
MEDDSPPGDASSLLRVLGASTVTLAVGLLVVGTLLLTTCQAETIVGPYTTTVGCGYPFQGYGLAFLYAAALLTITAGNLFARALKRGVMSQQFGDRLKVLSGLAFIGATGAFLFAFAVLGVS